MASQFLCTSKSVDLLQCMQSLKTCFLILLPHLLRRDEENLDASRHDKQKYEQQRKTRKLLWTSTIHYSGSCTLHFDPTESKMLTPSFDVSQDSECVTITIRVPYVKVTSSLVYS